MLIGEASGQWLQSHHPTLPAFDYHEQMKPWYKVFSFKSPLFKFTSSENLFLHPVLITSEFSQPPQWDSLCVCGQQLHSGNHRDSRVCQSNGGWHRTGCRSDSRNLRWRDANTVSIQATIFYINKRIDILKDLYRLSVFIFNSLVSSSWGVQELYSPYFICFLYKT